MPVVLVECPHCRRLYSVDDSLLGRAARCKNCSRDFSLTLSREIDTGNRVAASAPSPTLASGTWSRPASLPERIGRFLIRERLGAGAFGAVYRAFDPNLDREVALKVPHREIQQDPRASERFLREARAAARLNHPHIVPVYEAGTDGDTSYLACAFIPGRTLADALDDGPMEPRRAARIVAALADALHAAHREGIVHRDVKPSNILLDVDDQPRLADFGLARLAEGGRLTQAGTIIGTPAYLAPEQASGRSNEAEAPSDQYSLGATLYELLCGHVPFSGPIEIVIFHTLQTPPPPLRAERPEVPAELEAICLKALAKRPEDRYPSCPALADELRRWEASQVARASAVSAEAPLPFEPTDAGRTSHRRVRRHRGPAPAFAGVAIAAGLLGPMAAWVWFGDGRRPPAPIDIGRKGPERGKSAGPVRDPERPPPPVAQRPLPDLPSNVFAGPIEIVDAGPGPPARETKGPESGPALTTPEDPPAPAGTEHLPSADDLQLVGRFLLLRDDENKVATSIDQLRPLKERHDRASRRLAGLNAQAAAVFRDRVRLTQRRDEIQRAIDERQRLLGNAVEKDAVSSRIQRELRNELNAIGAEVNRLVALEAVEERRQLADEIATQRAALAARAPAVRSAVDRIQQAYAGFARNPEVAVRLREGGPSSKEKVKLGPSDDLLRKVKSLEVIEKVARGEETTRRAQTGATGAPRKR